ncbi:MULTISPECIES: GIY-YIG nuclease family protein [Mameliella]|uniref:GIY-YIG nuclease family protein n=1 Tax=Mameliella TaxID=1434019 RepID=UPI000B52DFF3|nr:MULTISPECIES: GIY-YIG nuclease family protein [Mameliella]MCR9272638.1 GIY-YIG nuclease family protein [Paracoccaceae bacterium]OWV60310.1 methionine sulfoxide reductase [Mameliella alba]
MSKGRSLELFFVDGRPDGMLTAEVFNWTGHILRIPRSRLADGLKRAHSQQTGVYVLIGSDNQGPLAYIGEAENVAKRIPGHDTDKDWWEEVVIVTTAGDALHKAHVKYLESRLVELAKSAGARLKNGNAPPRASLNEAAITNMESFVETVLMVLPAIRVDLFESGRRAATSFSEMPSENSERFLVRHSKGWQAKIDLIDGEFVVLAGARLRPSDDIPPSLISIAKKRQQLLATGALERATDHDVLLENLAFKSPSGASDFIMGQATSGLELLVHDQTGLKYRQWEESELKRSAR